MIMREIKFRAWDKTRKQWIENTGNPYVFPFNGKVAMTCAGNKTGHISETDYSEYYELSQFTGLHDKNGKEIYEEDIVKTIYGNRRVVYSQDIACYEIVSAGTARSLYGNIREPLGVEVIGNIFETPNLIEQEK
jgi:uncharacterized phage protein (TIGR01671 family)